MNDRARVPGVRGFVRLLHLLWLLWPGVGLRAQEPETGSLTIQNDPARQELALALGPIDLPAGAGPEEIAQLPVQRGTIPFDLMVHAYRVEAVDGAGNLVPHAVIHHFNMLDPSRRELFLPIMRRTFASGQETDPQQVPERLFGLPLCGGDPFLLLVKVFNPTDRSYEGVSVRLVLSYNRGDPQPQYRIYPFHLDVMFPLGVKAFDLPPGRTEKSWEGSPAIPGRILAMGGHLHMYAHSLRLEDLTEEALLYEIQPEVRDGGHLLHSVPVLRFTREGIGQPIDPTHVYRVTATYFNPTGETIPDGGMGSVGGAFIPDDETAWPAPDPTDPLYATDYRNVLVSPTDLGPGLREPYPQFIGTAVPATPPRLPVGRDQLVRVVDHPDEAVLELVVGPVALSTAGHHIRLPIQLVELPLEGWLHGHEWEITDSQGRKLPDELLHHVNLIDPDQRDLFSPVARRIMAAGRETSRQVAPRFVGYPVELGTRVLVAAMFARPTERDYEEVYLHVRLFYSREGDVAVRPLDVYPFYLDVMGPVGPKSFPIPPGGTVQSWTARPAIDGRIVALGAHLHDFARFIRLEDLTTGEVVWETEPHREADGRVTGVPTSIFASSGGLPIYKAHRYRLVVAYDNPTDRYDPEPGMGEIGGLILVSGEADWPPVDRQDPVYVADLTNTLEAPEKSQLLLEPR